MTEALTPKTGDYARLRDGKTIVGPIDIIATGPLAEIAGIAAPAKRKRRWTKWLPGVGVGYADSDIMRRRVRGVWSHRLPLEGDHE